MAHQDPMSLGLKALNKIAGSPVLDKLGIRDATERFVYRGSRSGFAAVTRAQRTFTKKTSQSDAARPTRSKTGVFDLNPTDDQQMMVDVIGEFASEVLRPGAEEAENANGTSKEVLAQTADFGLSLLNVPEVYGGLSEERSALTGVLVNEALAKGDLGQAVACLAPAAVATAVSLWGSSSQQQTYLPAFTSDDVPTSAVVVSEPHMLFDPFALRTTARRTSSGFLLDGLKSAAVNGAECELFVIAAHVEGTGPAMFLVEATTPGLTVADDPSMGLRAASLTRIKLDGVAVGHDALLGSAEDYREMIRLSRLAWAALALGTSASVLEYVKNYVVTRQAFGEPIAHRQAVAFTVADMAIELEGMRLATLKAASRADQNLSFAREVALAHELANTYAMKIATDGVQMLGGHGFVKEHPVERWYRDLRAIGLLEGAVLV